MKSLISVAALSVLLLGCAAPRSPQTQAHLDYATTYRPLAEQGKVRWSDYYTGLYSSAIAARPMPPASYLNRINDMIDRAKEYESGRISADAFASYRRAAQVGQIADAEAKQQQAADRNTAGLAGSAALIGIGLQTMQASQPRPIVPAIPAPRPTSCRSVYQGSGVTQTDCY